MHEHAETVAAIAEALDAYTARNLQHWSVLSAEDVARIAVEAIAQSDGQEATDG